MTGVQSLANPDLIVVVDHTLTSIDLSPDAAVVPYGLTRQFTATGIDQFGDTMALTSPSWTIDNSGPGQVSAGLYAAPASGSGGARPFASRPTARRPRRTLRLSSGTTRRSTSMA